MKEEKEKNQPTNSNDEVDKKIFRNIEESKIKNKVLKKLIDEIDRKLKEDMNKIK